MSKLEKYTSNIREHMKIVVNRHAGMLPSIEHQSFKFIKVSFDHKMLFHISTSGTDLTARGAIEYAKELEIASNICKDLNKCYKEDREKHMLDQLKHM
jgi:hypothetical protein